MGHTDQGDTWFTIQSVKTESVTAMPSLYRGHDTPEEVALPRDFWKVYYPKRYLWFWMKPSLFKLRKPSLVRQVKEAIFIHTQLLSMASAPAGGCSFQPAWALLCGSTVQCPLLSRELFYAFLRPNQTQHSPSTCCKLPRSSCILINATTSLSINSLGCIQWKGEGKCSGIGKNIQPIPVDHKHAYENQENKPFCHENINLR